MRLKFRLTLLFGLLTGCAPGFPQYSGEIARDAAVVAWASTLITRFSFTASANNLSQTYAGTISGNVISVRLPYGKAASAVPTIDGVAQTFQVNGSPVTNGVTPADFTSSRTLSVIGAFGVRVDYTVNVQLFFPVSDTAMVTCYDGSVSQLCSVTAATFPWQDVPEYSEPAGHRGPFCFCLVSSGFCEH